MSHALAVLVLSLSFASVANADDLEKRTPPADSKKIQNVKNVQEVLKAGGLDPGPIDGILGPRTRRALREFQRLRRLPVTGRIDSPTRVALTKELAELPLKPPENMRIIEIGEE